MIVVGCGGLETPGLQLRLGVRHQDPDPRGFQHLEVVPVVPDRESGAERQARFAGDPLERGALVGGARQDIQQTETGSGIFGPLEVDRVSERLREVAFGVAAGLRSSRDHQVQGVFHEDRVGFETRRRPDGAEIAGDARSRRRMGRDPDAAVAFADQGRNPEPPRSTDGPPRRRFRKRQFRDGAIETTDERASVGYLEGGRRKAPRQHLELRVAPPRNECERHPRGFRPGERGPVRCGDLLPRVQQGAVEVDGEKPEPGRGSGGRVAHPVSAAE